MGVEPLPQKLGWVMVFFNCMSSWEALLPLKVTCGQERVYD
jgi:hypothetical protein